MNYIITCIIDFFLDSLKRQFYYISTGLRVSVLHRDFFLMGCFEFIFIFQCSGPFALLSHQVRPFVNVNHFKNILIVSVLQTFICKAHPKHPEEDETPPNRHLMITSKQ